MNIQLAHKIELAPTNIQRGYFARACGTARFVWNWGLAEWNRQYKEGLKPSGPALKKAFNAIKKGEFPWVFDVLRDANSQPFSNLQAGFNNFFRGTANRPRFKRKGRRDSFYISNDKFKIEGNKIRIPKLGWVRMKESFCCFGEIVNATVSRTANRWFVSIGVKIDITPAACENQAVVGVDLGVKRLATLSTGEVIEGAKAYRRLEKKLRRLQQSFARKQMGSKNREKQKRKISRLHYRISCIRMDVLHKLTTRLVRKFSVLVIEDLNVLGMLKNRRLAKAISDMGFHEFRRQLDYKAQIAGAHVIVADRWFPSSKRCSACGEINRELTLSDRMFICPACSFKIDRDDNASRNLEMYPGLVN